MGDVAPSARDLQAPAPPPASRACTQPRVVPPAVAPPAPGVGRALRLEDGLERLRRFNANSPMPTRESVERAEEEEFGKLQAAEREEAERRCPSLRSIPRFYERRAKDVEEANALRPRVLRLASEQLTRRKLAEDLPESQDLHALSALLKEYSCSCAHDLSSQMEVMDYEGFVQIGEELAQRGHRFKTFFRPSTFLKFPRDKHGRIAIWFFFTFVRDLVSVRHTRWQLSKYDVVGCGYLREKDMENFIFELIPALPGLHRLQEEFYPFYVFTAVRKFFFFLDPKRTGRIRIRDLLTSQIIIKLFELREEEPLDAFEPTSNWFSRQSVENVYGVYLDLDADQNGMLSKGELSHYGSGMLTSVFIDRVFEEYQTYRDTETGEREVDYKAFLDFVLAMENKNSKQAIQYFWKLIDIEHKGYVDSFVINYFLRAILRSLQTKKSNVASVEDVEDEIFDMVKSETPGIITMQDLVNSRQGGTVLSMLIDAAAFWRYEERETLLMEPDDDACN